MSDAQSFRSGASVEQETCQAEPCEPILEPQRSIRQAVFQSVSGLFSGIFAEASIVKVDPLRCISIEELRSRTICRWGVKKIKNSILGQCSADSFVNGFVSTGNFSVIAEIPQENMDLVVEYFKRRGESHENAMTLAASGKWFHTVEGSHVHRALVECIDEFSEKFAGFRWPVVKISWQPADSLRAIGRMCNEMRKDDHIIDFPLPDVMRSLRDIIESHSTRTGVAVIPGERIKPGFIKEVVDIYAGRQGYSCNTLRTVCGIVLKMSTSFAGSMRSLLTEECDDLWKSLGAKRPFGDDTRVFKKLISTQSFKRTPNFFNQKHLTDEDRLNVIHRLRFVAKEREAFKAFSSAEIESQTSMAVAAKTEVDKFDAFMGEEEWPSDLENLKRNMLQTTLLDSVLREHTGGHDDLLPTMVSAYLKASGAHGSQKLGQYERMRELEKGQSDEVIATSACRHSRGDAGITENSVITTSNCVNNGQVVHVDGSSPIEGTEILDPVEEDLDVLLNTAGLELRVETLLEYERGSLGIDGSFDFIIADPFQKIGADPSEERNNNRSAVTHTNMDELIDEKGVTLYVQSMRRLLRRGGHLFVFLEWNQIQLWKTCCTESQFDVLCEPFLVMKDPERVQKMTLKGLQSMYEPALVLRKPGEHPDAFEIDKSSPYTYLPSCKLPRWCNVIDGVPPASRKVTFRPSRAQVRPNEKPCSLFIELLTTFCPPMGKVLDPFAATLTTGLACIATRRNCVLLETDEKCIYYAKPRAVNFVKSRLTESGADEEIHQEGNQHGVENGGAETIATDESTRSADEVDDNGSTEDGETCSALTTGLGTEQSQQGCGSNRNAQAQDNHSVIRSSEAGNVSIERGSQASSVSSPSTCKQLSFVTRENDNVRKAVVAREISTTSVKKRSRKHRSPANRTHIVEVSTPSAFRRSKRSRKVKKNYRA